MVAVVVVELTTTAVPPPVGMARKSYPVIGWLPVIAGAAHEPEMEPVPAVRLGASGACGIVLEEE